MNRLFIPLFLIIVIAAWIGYTFAGARLDYFRQNTSSPSSDVVLEWKANEETNLMRYDVQRRAGMNGEYVVLGSVNPTGSGSVYTYTDKSVYKSTDAVYKYRLAIFDTDNPVPAYSSELTVYPKISSVKRTWGSIKAMFR